MATLLFAKLAPGRQMMVLSLLLLAACQQGEPQIVDNPPDCHKQCARLAADLGSNRAVLDRLRAEQLELKAELERVTRELVMVKVERDKMAVELRAYGR